MTSKTAPAKTEPANETETPADASETPAMPDGLFDLSDLAVASKASGKIKERQSEFEAKIAALPPGDKTKAVVFPLGADKARAVKLRVTYAAKRLGIAVNVREATLKTTGERVVIAIRK